MAKILNDIELKKLISNNIIYGDESCMRPNAYILCLGVKGEYTHIGKDFYISKHKNGFKLPTGNSVTIMSLEVLDFHREAVYKLYKDYDLFAWMSAITDLSREGIVTQTTQIDGVLNWTFNNTSNKENLYRLMIFKLEDDEKITDKPYEGNYQNQKSVMRYKRKSVPIGMKAIEWEIPEKHLENLINSGYPWSILGERLKILDSS